MQIYKKNTLLLHKQIREKHENWIENVNTIAENNDEVLAMAQNK